jgi:hypothetical protein
LTIRTHVVDGVDSSSVLHGKQRDGNSDSLEVLGRPEEGLDRTPEPGTTGQLVPLVSDFDLLHFFHEVRVVLGEVSDVGQVLASLDVPALVYD